MKRLIPLALLSLFAASAAHAGPASDAVKFFYAPVKWEADAEYRDRFVDPARSLFDKNDQAPEGEIGCIDFSPGIDAQDYDDATVNKTLKLSEQVEGDMATVTATFNLFPQGEAVAREMQWTLQRVDGAWKIADIASVTNGWKLSELNCMPEN